MKVVINKRPFKLFFGGLDLSPKNSGLSLLDFSETSDSAFTPEVLPNCLKVIHPELEGSNRKSLSAYADRIAYWFSDYIKSIGISLNVTPLIIVGIENYVMQKFATSFENVLLHGAVSSSFFHTDLGFLLVHPDQLKKYVRKAKYVSKVEIYEYCKSIDGFEKNSESIPDGMLEHVSDATVLALVAYSFFSGRSVFQKDILPRHQEILDSMANNKKEFYYPFKLPEVKDVGR